jgi:hypothetical protein
MPARSYTMHSYARPLDWSTLFENGALQAENRRLRADTERNETELKARAIPRASDLKCGTYNNVQWQPAGDCEGYDYASSGNRRESEDCKRLVYCLHSITSGNALKATQVLQHLYKTSSLLEHSPDPIIDEILAPDPAAAGCRGHAVFRAVVVALCLLPSTHPPCFCCFRQGTSLASPSPK